MTLSWPVDNELQNLLREPWQTQTSPLGSGGPLTLTCDLLHRRLRSQASRAVESATELPLDGMGLTELSSQEEPCPLQRTPCLRRLSLSNNHLHDEALLRAGRNSFIAQEMLAVLPELRELSIDGNQLQWNLNRHKGAVSNTDKVLQHPKIETLSLASNAISSPPSLHMQRLTTLDLSGNRLAFQVTESPQSSTKPQVAACLVPWRTPLLTSLDLSRNVISSLSCLSGLVHLRILNVSCNKLSSFAGIETMTALEDIDASHNALKISRLTSHANPLKPIASSVLRLNVSCNAVTSLAFFPTGGLPRLAALNMSSNPLNGAALEAETPRRRDAADFQRGRCHDIDDAEYGDDGDLTAPSMKKNSGHISKGKMLAFSQSLDSARPSTGARTMGFWLRLCTLFPSMESLDASGLPPSLLSDVGDLRQLSKCAQLHDLHLGDTLVLPLELTNGDGPVSDSSRAAFIGSLLPSLESVDGCRFRQQTSVPVSLDCDDKLAHVLGEDLVMKLACLLPSVEQRPASAVTRSNVSVRGRPFSAGPPAAAGVADVERELREMQREAQDCVKNMEDAFRRMAASIQIAFRVSTSSHSLTTASNEVPAVQPTVEITPSKPVGAPSPPGKRPTSRAVSCDVPSPHRSPLTVKASSPARASRISLRTSSQGPVQVPTTTLGDVPKPPSFRQEQDAFKLQLMKDAEEKRRSAMAGRVRSAAPGAPDRWARQAQPTEESSIPLSKPATPSVSTKCDSACLTDSLIREDVESGVRQPTNQIARQSEYVVVNGDSRLIMQRASGTSSLGFESLRPTSASGPSSKSRPPRQTIPSTLPSSAKPSSAVDERRPTGAVPAPSQRVTDVTVPPPSAVDSLVHVGAPASLNVRVRPLKGAR